MSSPPRYLITTADERTWKFDRPVLFLGEWCRLYARQHIWRDMDAQVAEPYGLGQAQKDSDHAEARALEAELLPLLCTALNQYHQTQHGQRFWQIVLGHWFRRYIDIILNRVRTLEQCFLHHQVDGISAFSNVQYSLAPQTSYAAIRAFNDARWNAELYARIWSHLDTANCRLELAGSDAATGFHWPLKSAAHSPARRMLAWGYRAIKNGATCLTRKTDAVIVNSFLSRRSEIRLQLALQQFPQMLDSGWMQLPAIDVDSAVRQRLAKEIPRCPDAKLADIMRVMLFELLPVCYLEGFTSLCQSAKALPWPSNPKLIFTSNNFDTDEVFKVWTAAKSESGFKYIAGQHGNNYGTSRYMNPSVEEMTADQFLTWGWTDGLSQHQPAFIFKLSDTRPQSYNPAGGLLLIELHAGQMLSTWDVVAEFDAYFKDQLLFAANLDGTSKKNLTVRLHHEFRNLGWSDQERWHDFDPKINLNVGGVAIGKLISQNRLVVHSYDSTGVLETLAQNIPTLAFWPDGLAHLRDSAKPYYQLLVNAGIIHFSPASAAAKVNEIWGDVEGWWMSPEIQVARQAFCNRYARVCHEPVARLRQILMGVSDHRRELEIK